MMMVEMKIELIELDEMMMMNIYENDQLHFLDLKLKKYI
jgi:hypothetical protein